MNNTEWLLVVFVFKFWIGFTLSEPISVSSDYPVVKTLTGSVRGLEKTTLDKNVQVFLGIPYAEPPINDLRFKKPVPKNPWSDVWNATHLPNSCYQDLSEMFPGFIGEEIWRVNTPISEDCLYLNVWVPSKIRQSGNAAVLLWIHGGSYTIGTGTLDVFDGSILAATNDVIVVTINYRLGPFGFIYLPSDDTPGNVGLYDQSLAIKWVKDNIASFGGNPELLTLFGGSAGAGSVSFQLMSPISQNLTRRAILDSGSFNSPLHYMLAPDAKLNSLRLADDVGCNSALFETDPGEGMECLRSVPPSNLSASLLRLPLIKGVNLGPTIDGVFILKHPEEMLRDGDFSKMETIVGTNQDEGSHIILLVTPQSYNKDVPDLMTREMFMRILGLMLPDSSQLEREAIFQQYNDWEHIPNANDSELVKKGADLSGDNLIACPVNYFAEKLAEHGSNVYFYHFTHRSSSSPWGKWMGVRHGDETEFIFGRPLNPNFNFTKSEKELSCRMMKYYTNFAKTGKPEADGLWPNYSSQNPRHIIFNGEASGLGIGPNAMRCNFWNHFLPFLRKRIANNQCPKASESQVPSDKTKY